MKTPEYVKGAVLLFIEQDRREPLIQQFKNGIPLFKYPESRELIVKALTQVSPRGRGQNKKDLGKEDLEIGAIMLWATLEGAGFPRYGDSTSALVVYGYEIVEKAWGFSLKQLKSYWKKHNADPRISAQIGRQIGYGKKNKTSLEAVYLKYLKSAI
tara:strand:- start:344 stop:811 length:468 start_codon:yes stop_codon:yes gene_type:complete